MTELLDWRIQLFDSLDSTQTWLCSQAESLPAGSCALAHSQHAGRGREGRGWQSEAGGLYASFLLKPEGLLPELPWALWWAVLETLEQASGCELRLKAPNDVLAQGRKLAGMLIDSRILGSRPLYYVCGVGINLNQSRFEGALEQTAVSLQQLTGRCSEPAELLQQLLERFGRLYPLLLAGRFAAEILAALGGRPVQIGYNGRNVMVFEEYWHGREHG